MNKGNFYSHFYREINQPELQLAARSRHSSCPLRCPSLADDDRVHTFVFPEIENYLLNFLFSDSLTHAKERKFDTTKKEKRTYGAGHWEIIPNSMNR